MLYIFIFSLLFFSTSLSQYNNLTFRHLTVREGLSQNFVRTIVQDGEGFMWFSTNDGLNKYDGYEFKVYRCDPFDSTSLSGRMITASYVDSQGRLWIGTNTLSLFLPDKNRFDNIDVRAEFSRRKDLRSFGEITSITEDKNGIIWAGTDDGLIYYNPLKGVYKFLYDGQDSSKDQSDNYICSLISRDSLLLVGTMNGLKLINLNDIKVSDSKNAEIIHLSSEEIIASKRSILSQFLISKNILYCGTYEGLVKIDLSKKTSEYLPYQNHKFIPEWTRKIVSICGDKEGNIWLACAGGLVIYNPLKNEFRYYFHNPLDAKSLSLNNITCLYADRQGKIWIGTGGKGINIYDQNRKTFSLYNGFPDREPFLSSFSVSSVLSDSRGVLWISAHPRVYRLDRTTGTYDPVKFPERFVGVINSILEDKNKNIWISSSNGIYKMSETGKIITNYIHDPSDSTSLKDNFVKLLYIGREGNLYAFNSNYLSKLDAASGSFTHYKLIFNNIPDYIPIIKSIFETDDGWFWFGWTEGLVKYNLKTHESFIFRNRPGDENSLTGNEVLTFCSDPKQPEKYLWLGTNGGGLDRLNLKNKTFKNFSVADGLPNNVVYGILSSGGNELWLSTNNGLCRAAIDENGITNTKNYYESDGLQGNEFNTGAYSKNQNGELFFGGLYGINAFFPSRIKDNDFIPPVVFTELKFLTNKSAGDNNSDLIMDYIQNSSVLTIPHSENSFSIQFASLDFTEPEKNKYMYMLKPIHENWVNIGTHRNVIFTDLAPGDYEILVKGSNNDGIWSENRASLKIIIQPSFWESRWAYLLYILIAFGLLYSIRHYELNRQLWKHNLELETVEAYKYKELNEMKSRFFANISHEFRTPLTLILGPSESIISEAPGESVLKKAEIIKKNAKRLLILINQLLDLSKIEAGKLELRTSKSNIVSFLKGITMSFESMAERKDITLKVIAEKDEIELYFDNEKMIAIMANLLSNAFKFTGVGGHITVTIHEIEGSTVKIKIRDTGIGIAAEELPKLFDRFYQVDSSQTRENEGTGIGLALVKELVELHCGTISVDSTLGTGTEFTIDLPLGRNHLRDYEIVEASEPVTSEGFNDAGEEVSSKILDTSKQENDNEERDIILIVEDNRDVREFIKDSLGADFEIVEASNGEQGIRRAEQIIPDLVICDIMMPKMDGIEMTKILKNDEKTSHIPIIMLTAKSEQQSRMEGLETGADDYLTKPFDTKELTIRIKNLIKIRENLQAKYGRESYKPSKKEENIKMNDREGQFLSKALEVVEKHISEENFSIEQFGKEVGMSRVQLHRKLKTLTGKSASNYLKRVRLSKAKELIEGGRGNISEIAYSVGFSSPAYFTRCFKEEFGYPPSDLLS